MPHGFEMPPRIMTDKGEPRKVGIEIEFSGLDAAETATLLYEMFGGELSEEDPHAFKLTGSRLGTFDIELDTQYAHPKADERGSSAWRLGREAVGAVMGLWLPTEIDSAPLPFDRLPELDAIIGVLRNRGAVGTKAELVYAFSLQFNPEAPSLETADLLAVMRAYMVVEPALRRESGTDRLRRMLPFIQPYPNDYVRKVLDWGYAPTRAQMIDDYLAANPTRNRGLDMLPLFAELDHDRVQAAVPDQRIKPRPTFHYRLPDCRIDEPDWSMALEWNRWVAVERLAEDPDRLPKAAAARLANLRRGIIEDWAERALEWLKL